MATFRELIDEIALDLSESASNDLDDEIKAAINRAIEDYQNERFEFNEGTTDITTVIDQAEYDKATHWPNVLIFDQVQYLRAGHLYPLDRQSWEWYVNAVSLEASQTGPSSDFVIYDETLYLYTQPDEVTTVTISGVHRLLGSVSGTQELTADADTNAWLQGQALQMIKARAKADVYFNRMGNVEMAGTCADIAKDYLGKLRSDRDRQQMVQATRPARYF